MGVAAVSSLLLKWRKEVPKRPFNVFFMDGFKQGTGVLLQHFANLFFSIIAGNKQGSDPCAWYLGTLFIDSLVGTFVCYLLTKLHGYIVQRCEPRLSLLKFGEYGNPPSCKPFTLQLFVWYVYILLSRLVVYPLLFLLGTPLTALFSFLLKPLANYHNLKIFIVVFLVPFIVNVSIFWVQDSFIKMSDRRSKAASRHTNPSPTMPDDADDSSLPPLLDSSQRLSGLSSEMQEQKDRHSESSEKLLFPQPSNSLKNIDDDIFDLSV
ncbi:putative Store-operated calcium entry regulator STIMATE [Blattamonas nauphoetae]|uniref:Store-operated calcium entry regulator STIMATE n=1 Tax=Blattamonas nauphoetae TaxID=2049346 RepID=A0ABQ9Y1W8_9EUKA|nr:putative Store-operated calcium entry regulator STIMATE [Blattamonas nauphoetae]